MNGFNIRKEIKFVKQRLEKSNSQLEQMMDKYFLDKNKRIEDLNLDSFNFKPYLKLVNQPN